MNCHSPEHGHKLKISSTKEHEERLLFQEFTSCSSWMKKALWMTVCEWQVMQLTLHTQIQTAKVRESADQVNLATGHPALGLGNPGALDLDVQAPGLENPGAMGFHWDNS
jgi:hypothetical protein